MYTTTQIINSSRSGFFFTYMSRVVAKTKLLMIKVSILREEEEGDLRI